MRLCREVGRAHRDEGAEATLLVHDAREQHRGRLNLRATGPGRACPHVDADKILRRTGHVAPGWRLRAAGAGNRHAHPARGTVRRAKVASGVLVARGRGARVAAKLKLGKLS